MLYCGGNLRGLGRETGSSRHTSKYEHYPISFALLSWPDQRYLYLRQISVLVQLDDGENRRRSDELREALEGIRPQPSAIYPT